MSGHVGVDDYALARVPQSERYSWWSVAVQRFGQVSALSQFLLGSTIGFGMMFWDAFWAFTLGAVILEIVSILIGLIGAKEGLQTSLLARWTGFGYGGSSVVGIAIGISLIGWFGIQSGVSAEGLVSLIGVLPIWGWSLVFGLIVTLIVMGGFGSMKWVAYITVPAFLVLVAWSMAQELSGHNFGDLVRSAPAGEPMSLLTGTTLVAGGFIVGAVITADMTRFNRNGADVVKQTVVGFTIGEYLIGMSGVLLAHAVQSDNIITIVTSSVGWVGTLVIILGTVKINDWNLYSSSLGAVNFLGVILKRPVNRGVLTLIIGVIGSVLAAAGILSKFTDFLILLGVAFPPIVGIIVAEYFVVKLWRPELDRTREAGTLPETSPTWVPATLVIWVVSAVVGKFVAWGLPSINSLVVAFVLYVVAGKAGLIKGYGVSRTETAGPVDASAAAPSTTSKKVQA
ncbi:MAG: cytosine permease [Nakamurella sp.]